VKGRTEIFFVDGTDFEGGEKLRGAQQRYGERESANNGILKRILAFRLGCREKGAKNIDRKERGRGRETSDKPLACYPMLSPELVQELCEIEQHIYGPGVKVSLST